MPFVVSHHKPQINLSFLISYFQFNNSTKRYLSTVGHSVVAIAVVLSAILVVPGSMSLLNYTVFTKVTLYTNTHQVSTTYHS